jgi:hypothetical protein
LYRYITANKIRRLEGLHGLDALEHLLLQANLVSSVEELKHLQCLPNLRTLYMKNVDGSQPNPVGLYKLKAVGTISLKAPSFTT